jgi:hypothetical protein
VLFVDAALDHLPRAGAGESSNDPVWVRGALNPVKRLTRELDIVGLYSMHPPKARSPRFRDLVQQSQAFAAVPRVGLLFDYHPDDDADHPDRRRVLLRGKGNLGRDPGAVSFRVTGKPYRHDDGRATEREVVVDVEPCGVTITDLAPDRVVGTPREPTKTERATEVLREQLADGQWHLAGDVQAHLDEHGVGSASVVTEAKRNAHVEARKRPGEEHGPWEWRIATPEAPDDTLEPCATARATSPSQGALAFTDENPNNDGKAPRRRYSPQDGPAVQGSPAHWDTRACAQEPANNALMGDAIEVGDATPEEQVIELTKNERDYAERFKRDHAESRWGR